MSTDVCCHWFDFIHGLSFIFGLPVRAMPNQKMEATSTLRSKKTKWWTELPEGFAYSIPPSLGPIFAGRGRVILGYLANRFGSRFERTQNYCRELLALYLHRMIL